MYPYTINPNNLLFKIFILLSRFSGYSKKIIRYLYFEYIKYSDSFLIVDSLRGNWRVPFPALDASIYHVAIIKCEVHGNCIAPYSTVSSLTDTSRCSLSDFLNAMANVYYFLP